MTKWRIFILVIAGVLTQVSANFIAAWLGYDLNGRLIVSLAWTFASTVLITMYYIYHPVQSENTALPDTIQDVGIDLSSITHAILANPKSQTLKNTIGEKKLISVFAFAGQEVKTYRMQYVEDESENLSGTVWTMTIEKVDCEVSIQMILMNVEGNTINISFEEANTNR